VSRPLEDYALLSDLQTAGLVSRDGSVDWLCVPRFDSGACFAALLGDEENGRWVLEPTAPVVASTRRYRGDTLILETELETDGGAVRLTEFMPPRGNDPDIVRIVEGMRGEVAMRSELVIRFDYGSIVPWMRRVGKRRIAIAGGDAVAFTTPARTRGENLRTISEFTVREGERVPFVVTWFPSHHDAPTPVDPEQALRDTEDYWRDWAAGCTYQGTWREAVIRSLIVLKALVYQPTGAIVAAPTTSLPEQLGGVRNWDYRFCWLRDGTLTLHAFLEAGLRQEAEAWRSWLLRAVAGDPADLQVVYGVMGERRLTELELDWLAGYEGSRPVRTGNDACMQLQIDVYGEVMAALYQARECGIELNASAWALQRLLLRHLEHAWREPDEGIWEIRGPRRQFVHSKVLAWVAFDRGVRSIEQQGLEGPVDRWRKVRDEIHEEVCRKGFDERLGSFTQHYGSGTVDASLLLMPLVGFLPPDDERVLGTIRAIERHLVVDGFVLRYQSETDVDGLPPGEGVFLPCAFWLAEALAVTGREEEARAYFERALATQNDLGLIAEEFDPAAGRLLGNFPQAFTHLALVSAAFCLDREREARSIRSPR
jgi:GH15 family glucan-1,4-alpha-glucosidase